jgi:hypothetical protein
MNGDSSINNELNATNAQDETFSSAINNKTELGVRIS